MSILRAGQQFRQAAQLHKHTRLPALSSKAPNTRSHGSERRQGRCVGSCQTAYLGSFGECRLATVMYMQPGRFIEWIPPWFFCSLMAALATKNYSYWYRSLITRSITSLDLNLDPVICPISPIKPFMYTPYCFTKNLEDLSSEFDNSVLLWLLFSDQEGAITLVTEHDEG